MSLDSTKLLKVIPDIPMEFAQAIRDLGLVLLNDDIHDVGYFTYYGRRRHVYKGKRAPDHPSPFHHWQVAIGMLFAAKFMGMISLARDNLVAYREFELEETAEEREINYKEYMKEIERRGYKNNTIPDPKPQQAIEFKDYEVVDNEPGGDILPNKNIMNTPQIKAEPSGVLPPKEAVPIIPPTRKSLSMKIPKLSIHL